MGCRQTDLASACVRYEKCLENDVQEARRPNASKIAEVRTC